MGVGSIVGGDGNNNDKMKKALEKALENGVWVLYSFFCLIRDACYRQAGYMYIMNTFSEHIR